MSEPEFNAAQRAHFQRALEEQLIKYVKTIELKKWSIDKAAALWAAQPVQPKHFHDGSSVEFTDPIALAKEIYEFVRS